MNQTMFEHLLREIAQDQADRWREAFARLLCEAAGEELTIQAWVCQLQSDDRQAYVQLLGPRDETRRDDPYLYCFDSLETQLQAPERLLGVTVSVSLFLLNAYLRPGCLGICLNPGLQSRYLPLAFLHNHLDGELRDMIQSAQAELRKAGIRQGRLPDLPAIG